MLVFALHGLKGHKDISKQIQRTHVPAMLSVMVRLLINQHLIHLGKVSFAFVCES